MTREPHQHYSSRHNKRCSIGPSRRDVLLFPLSFSFCPPRNSPDGSARQRSFQNYLRFFQLNFILRRPRRCSWQNPQPSPTRILHRNNQLIMNGHPHRGLPDVSKCRFLRPAVLHWHRSATSILLQRIAVRNCCIFNTRRRRQQQRPRNSGRPGLPLRSRGETRFLRPVALPAFGHRRPRSPFQRKRACSPAFRLPPSNL